MWRDFAEVRKYKALVWALVTRYLAMRYRGSVLGFLWSFLNPLCLMLVYVLVFHYYIRFNDVDNYTVFLFCGLLPWIWLSSALLEGSSSIVSGGHLITKSMFPPQILPVVSTLTTMINFLFSLPLLLLFMWAYGMTFHWTLVFLPFLVLAQAFLLLGCTLLLGTINVPYRDVQHIVANLLTFLFFLCPILYPITSVPKAFRFTLDLNPLALLTMFYHDLILEGSLPSLAAVSYFSAASMIVFFVGIKVFDSYRESFAEML